jgi:hypothetical protein
MKAMMKEYEVDTNEFGGDNDDPEMAELEAMHKLNEKSKLLSPN